MRLFSVAFLVVASLGTPARADDGPSEKLLIAGEVTAAAAVGIGLLVGSRFIGDPLEFGRGGLDSLAAASLFLVPALQGFVVCELGSLSDHYSGGCGWPILAAYLGMAPFVGLAFLTAATAEDALGAGLGAALSLGLGFVIGAPIGATWAWNAKKVAKARASLALPPAAPERAPGARESGRSARGLTLVALRF